MGWASRAGAGEILPRDKGQWGATVSQWRMSLGPGSLIIYLAGCNQPLWSSNTQDTGCSPKALCFLNSSIKPIPVNSLSMYSIEPCSLFSCLIQSVNRLLVKFDSGSLWGSGERGGRGLGRGTNRDGPWQNEEAEVFFSFFSLTPYWVGAPGVTLMEGAIWCDTGVHAYVRGNMTVRHQDLRVHTVCIGVLWSIYPLLICFSTLFISHTIWRLLLLLNQWVGTLTQSNLQWIVLTNTTTLS